MFSRDDFAAKTDLPAGQVDDYALWGGLLAKWNGRINLVAPSTLDDFWHRHAYDSWQVVRYIKDDVKTVIDLGSGAGFPALALAIHMKAKGSGHVTLVESAGKKANFLRTVIRTLNLPAAVLYVRAEAINPENFDVITARAFAPLERLLSYAHPFWGPHSQGVFLKGRGLAHEVREAQNDWSFSYTAHESLTDETGSVVEVINLNPKNMEDI